jgi:hypothetical protein
MHDVRHEFMARHETVVTGQWLAKQPSSVTASRRKPRPSGRAQTSHSVPLGHGAVAVGSVRAYPNGFEFTVHIRLRLEDEAGWPGHSDPFDRHRARRGAGWNDDQLRLGILYADGRRAATTSPRYRSPDDDDDGHLVLQQGGGGGSGRSQDWDFWVHPLPPDGPVTLVASWAKHNIAESRGELDGAAIRAAARMPCRCGPKSRTSSSMMPGRATRSPGHA